MRRDRQRGANMSSALVAGGGGRWAGATPQDKLVTAGKARIGLTCKLNTCWFGTRSWFWPQVVGGRALVVQQHLHGLAGFSKLLRNFDHNRIRRYSSRSALADTAFVGPRPCRAWARPHAQIKPDSLLPAHRPSSAAVRRPPGDQERLAAGCSPRQSLAVDRTGSRDVGDRIRGEQRAPRRPSRVCKPIILCRAPSPLPFALQYDLSTSTFSPDGRVFQTDYAQKAVDNSGCAARAVAAAAALWLSTCLAAAAGSDCSC